MPKTNSAMTMSLPPTVTSTRSLAGITPLASYINYVQSVVELVYGIFHYTVWKMGSVCLVDVHDSANENIIAPALKLITCSSVCAF